MKIPNKSTVTPVNEAEISRQLRELAVAQGLALPVSEKEVEIFEESFLDEIELADSDRPSLESLLALANIAKSSSISFLSPIDRESSVDVYAMAARDGGIVNEETNRLMDKALLAVRNKGKNES